MCQRGCVVHPDQLAVAQHGDAIGDLVDLIDEVGDEDDRRSLALEFAHHPEQLAGLISVEAGGRLVQDQYLGRGDFQRTSNGCHLLDCDRVRPKRSRHVDVYIEPQQDLARLGVHAFPVDAAGPARLAADQDVFGHGQIRAQVDLLIDGADAEILSMLR